MKIKEVLYLLRDDLENLPPSMTQILALCKAGCSVKVVTMRASTYIQDFYKDKPVEFVSLSECETYRKNVFTKAYGVALYRRLVCGTIKNSKYDLLWIGSADTARYCRDLLAKTEVPTVLNIYELYDGSPEVIKAIRSIAQKAKCVVVPEYNRAHILKVWLGLRKTPIIIPNKPRFPDTKISAETRAIVDSLNKENKKIILYQGWIGKDRDISQIARALDRLDNKNEYLLLLLGKATYPETIARIQDIFDATIHIPFLKPPQHLFVTELAHIGIATYDDSNLNNVFCAPNKIYEYADKKVPILARDIPGLSNTVGKHRAGICVDIDDVDAVMAAIKELSINHDKYVDSLVDLLGECDVEKSIAQIIQTCEESIQ